MATPYTSSAAQAWKSSELRAVNLPTANGGSNAAAAARQTGRYASAPRMGGGGLNGGGGAGAEPYVTQRSMTPNRYVATAAGGYNRTDDTEGPPPAASASAAALMTTDTEPRTPSSTGLIRLSLKKPMGIVFEPMYDPNQPAVQRGVRICDLPRTGAAALSRKLQVGDELLQINDTTVSRLTFDEIMDFIIEADPESVNLLFRRPRKETLQARQGVQQKLNAAANKDNPSTVKWVDEARGGAGGGGGSEKKKSGSGGGKDRSSSKSGGGGGGGSENNKKSSSSKDHKRSKRSKKETASEEDETVQSSTGGEDSYVKSSSHHHHRSRKKSKSRRDPYESESFLDLLIDTICSNSNNVCRDTFRRNDEEYFSEDDESFGSEAEDESTYVTYEESVEQQQKKSSKHRSSSSNKKDAGTYDDTETDTLEESKQHRSSSRHTKKQHHHKDKMDKADHHHPKQQLPAEKKPYEDDGTLETVDSNDRAKQDVMVPPPPGPQPQPPLGLAPPVLPQQQPELPLLTPQQQQQQQQLQQPALPAGQSDTDDDGNPAPIKEVEYDDRIDHGADVSVMESLGGPSLLIEKQRAAAHAAAAQKSSSATQTVPADIQDSFGLDYPADFGMTREQTIDADPLKFYTYVVRGLLEQHEPEKVRLLDKLLAKYKGREDHLVQKLSVRYNRSSEEIAANQTQTPSATIPEEHDEVAFTDAVKKSKASSSAAAAVQSAKELHNSHAATTTTAAAAEQHQHQQQRPEDEPPLQPQQHSQQSSSQQAQLQQHHEWPEKEQKEPDAGDEGEDSAGSDSDYSGDSVDGTSPAVIAQVSELLNYVYGKTSVPGQIDRVSTIMRAYEGREAVLLELLETKALIKANKEKENADNLPAFLRNSQMQQQAQKNAEEIGSSTTELPPVTPMATTTTTTQTTPVSGTVINDDISSMSGVSSPATEQDPPSSGIVNQSTDEVEVMHYPHKEESNYVSPPIKEGPPKINAATAALASKSFAKPPTTPDKDKKKKKGLFGGLFGKKKGRDSNNNNNVGGTMTPGRAGSRTRNPRKQLRGVTSVEGSI